jgi:hypothetical protein
VDFFKPELSPASAAASDPVHGRRRRWPFVSSAVLAMRTS